jgi:cytochrome c-type biogenesis protein CcmH
MNAVHRAWIIPAAAIAAAVTLVAFALWAFRGERSATASKGAAPMAASAGAAAGAPGAPSPRAAPGLDVMAQRLAARLESTGSNDGGEWELLARSYLELRRYPDAVKAFERARKLRGDVDAQLLADYADALAVSNGKHFDAAVRELIAAALKIDPANAKAIELDASAAYEARDYRRAVAQWERLLLKTDPSSDHGRVLAANIAQARAQAGMPPSAGQPSPSAAPAPPAATGPAWMPQSMKDTKAAGR